MRARRVVAFGCVLAAACMRGGEGEAPPMRDQSTYAPRMFIAIPPADTGPAPFEGSLGPPRDPVVPRMLGVATTTREGSAGPPFRAGFGGEERRTGVVQGSEIRVEGPDNDAW